ncbi:MAG: diiron oxygenase [Polyangiales bacterium]
MLELKYDYATCVRNSEKMAWRVDEVMPPDTRLDFTRPFLPEALSGERKLDFLSDDARLKLNQITGHAYLNLFAFVEEYIIATAVRHAQAEMHGDHHAIRALVRFADEEIKHQQLFYRYLEAFKDGFGHECEVLGDAAAVAGVILSKSPMAVLLVTLHLEIMTQAHYTESVRDDDTIDHLFARLLKHHWMEEAQHARIDALELDKLVSEAAPPQLEKAFADYQDLIGAFDGLLEAQAKMDLPSLKRATGKSFTSEQEEAIIRAQHAAYRNTFLVLGMKNRMFMDIVSTIHADGAQRIAERAQSLS